MIVSPNVENDCINCCSRCKTCVTQEYNCKYVVFAIVFLFFLTQSSKIQLQIQLVE